MAIDVAGQSSYLEDLRERAQEIHDDRYDLLVANPLLELEYTPTHVMCVIRPTSKCLK